MTTTTEPTRDVVWTSEDCRREATARNIGRARRVFLCRPVGFDWALRIRDFRFNRGFGGMYGAIGVPPLALILPSAMLFWMVEGPTAGRVTAVVVVQVIALTAWLLPPTRRLLTPLGRSPRLTLFAAAVLAAASWWRGWYALILLAVAVGALLVGARTLAARNRQHLMPEWQLSIILAVGLTVWIAGRSHSEFNDAMYRHLLLIAVPCLIAAPILVAHAVAAVLLTDIHRDHRADFRSLLERVEVFPSPGFRDLSWPSIFRSLINAPLRYPLHLLYIPAVVVLVTPFWWRADLWAAAAASLGLTWLFLSFATLHPRLDVFARLSTRLLFLGGQGLVSLAIIVLAAARLRQIGYVATVIESASVWLLLSYTLAVYTVFWFYEYWTNAVITAQLLELLRNDTDPAGRVTYDLDAGVPAASYVERTKRVIQLHGAARLIAIANLTNPGSGYVEGFHSYNKVSIFNHLVENAPAGVDRGKMRSVVDDLRERVWFYFGVLNMLVVAIAGGGMYWLSTKWQFPEAEVTTAAPGTVDLRKLLFDDTENGARRQAILIAASGGGTRAALYTESLLHGLHTEGALSDVVLTSGVSGGGAALAYFAGRRDQLLAADEDAWQRFGCAMSEPFIQDVLLGAAEWRVATGTRLGQLLADSFRRRFGFNLTGTGDVPEVGLIFNTSLAGQLACPKCTQATWRASMHDLTPQTRADVAGGRLIFTNLANPDAFPSRGLPEAPDQRLTYVVVNRNVPLITAAALNANFPPVFSNAAVDVDYRNRYWVTDGGIVDNRGIESLLFALRDALLRQQAGQSPHQPVRRLPRIHVIVAEASASTIDYQQDRGVGSTLGASSQFASQLMIELMHQIRGIWSSLGGAETELQFHYLTMPTTLRIRGGIGTHWMLPRVVTVTDPNDADAGHAAHETVDATIIRAEIDGLHQPRPVGPVTCPDESGLSELLSAVSFQPDLVQVQKWIDQDPHKEQWAALKGALHPTQTTR